MPNETFIVYKTTNTVNDKYYIGKHRIGPKSDTYLGSGRDLNIDVRLYGRDKFIRETLYICDNETECFRVEAELVTEETVADPQCYNITTGGRGGRTQSESTKKLISEAVKNEWKDNDERVLANRERFIALHRAGKVGKASLTQESRKLLSTKSKNRWADCEYKQKVSSAISKGKKGLKQTEEHRVNNVRAQNEKIHCPHCNTYNKVAAHGRWHGDKCKGK